MHNDPQVKQALKLLMSKGITVKQIESVYRYWDHLERKIDVEYQAYVDKCKHLGFMPNEREVWLKHL